MNKHQRVIKKLVKYGIFAAIVIVVNLGILIFLMQYNDSLDKDISGIERETRNLSRENQELLSKQERAKASLDLYERLIGNNAENTFSVEKRVITRLLRDLNNEYQLRNLQLEVKPVQYKEEAPFTLKTGTLIASDVMISFESITDSFAYAFTDHLFEGLANFLLVRKFAIKKDGDVKAKFADSSSKGAIPSLAKGNLQFRWIGLRVDETNE